MQWYCISQQSLSHDVDARVTQSHEFWAQYHLSDLKLSFHLKPIGIRKDILKYFIDFDIVPNRLVFRAFARSDIMS
jgi:hypothetical protein